MHEGIEVSGMILSVSPAGEADRRAVLLTKELGKISAFARGARRPTSPLVGSVRPFAFGKFTLIEGRSAYSLQKASVSAYFEALSADVASSAYAFSFTELASFFTRENADEGGTLALLYYAMRALEGGRIPKKLVEAVFECRILAENGLLPAFTHCARCRKPLTEGAFSPALMQPLCTDCAGEKPMYPLSKSAVYALEYIRTSPVGKLYTFTVSEPVLKELSEITDYLVRQNVDRELPARAMLRTLVSDE